MTSNLSIALSTNANRADAPWINLEQQLATESPYANLQDLWNMFSFAQSGLTANSYNNDCENMSIDSDTISIPLKIWVWPSAMDLQYTLSNALDDGSTVAMTVSPARLVEVYRSDSIVVGLADNYVFDHLLSLQNFQLETPCYNRLGEQILMPFFEVKENKILFDAPFFASARVRYKAIGYEHTVTLHYPNDKAGIGQIKDDLAAQQSHVAAAEVDTRVKINVSNVTLIASYVDNSATSGAKLQQNTLGLQIPESVANCLSQCPDGSLIGGGSTTINDGDDDDGQDQDQEPETEEWLDVYYSTCSGKVIDTNRRTVTKPAGESV